MSDNKTQDKAPKGTVSRLLTYLKPYRGRMVIIFILTILSTFFVIVAPALIGQITTALFDGAAKGKFDWNLIMMLLAALGGSYAISQLFAFIHGAILNTLTARVIQRLRTEIDEKVHRLTLNYYDTHTAGEILSVITNDVDTLTNELVNNLTSLVTQIATAIGVLIMLFLIDVSLALFSLGTVVVALLASRGLIALSGKMFTQQQNEVGSLNGYIEEMYTGQNVVQAFNHQESAAEQFRKINDHLVGTAKKATTASAMIFPTVTVVTGIGYALLAIVGCMSAFEGAVAVGEVVSILQYTQQFTQPFTEVTSLIGGVSAGLAASGRIFDLLDTEEEIPDPEEGLVPTENVGSVEFEHVTFGYVPGSTLMHDVSFTAKPGQKVAIVGPTGAGKTTLINLLLRFYEINGGTIRVDGVDSSKMTRAELRRHFGMVLQETWLFEGTIRDNLAYARDGVTDDEIVEAAKAASVDSIINALPGGYDMVLSPGAENVSQGERQLLTIARAIASAPKIMILDEATSNVDARTEAVIQRALAQLMKGRTSFVIAHRLSTIRDADMILYMEKGDILEVGTHDELMELHGKYETLYLSQFA